MRRSTLDALLSIGGAIVAAVLLVAGGLLEVVPSLVEVEVAVPRLTPALR